MYRHLYGIRANILRVSNAYGSRQRAERGQGAIGAFLNAVRAGETIRIFGDGSVVRDYVYVADIARATVALARLATAAECVVNVGSGTGHSLLPGPRRRALNHRDTTPSCSSASRGPSTCARSCSTSPALPPSSTGTRLALEEGVALTWKRSERRWEVAGR